MMGRKIKWLVSVVLACVISSSFATEQTTFKKTTTRQTNVSSESILRNQWGLDETEWSKYKEVMKGIRGSLSVSTISPLEVLGIHAETDKERRKYAMAWAKLMKEDTERVLKFQFAFDDAAREINDRSKIIDMAKLNQIRKNQNQSSGPIRENDRVVLFVRSENCFACEARAMELQSEISKYKNVQFDIFFIDTTKGKDDKKLRDWSTRVGIDRNRLIKGKITINHDKELINKYFGFTADVPVAAVIRNETISKI